MSILVVLKLGKGDWQTGFFNVSVLVWESQNQIPLQFIGSLPSAPELEEVYQHWRTLYEALSVNLSFRRSSLPGGFEFDENDVTQVSDEEFFALCDKLKRMLNLWVDSPSFSRLEGQLRSHLNVNSEIRMIIETETPQLQQFPWNLWRFFDDYPYAEISLSPQEYKRIPTVPRKNAGQVRILAILGNSTGIDVEQDQLMLQQLTEVEIVWLVEPRRRDLDEHLWDERGWDILFFAGHSWTHPEQGTGYLEINPTERITIEHLRNALSAALARGLKLGIFNSCDGLGLGRELASLSIPQIIVMREAVPDMVAQNFLKLFLRAFSGGKSFYLAVREARERLQGLESEFPCASWLPVICQNPAATSFSWKQLQGNPQPDKPPLKVPVRPRLSRILLMSIPLTLMVMGGRWLGIWQSLELKAFDTLMKQRPTESADSRLLIIGMDEKDISQYGYPLPDDKLAQLLNQLTAYQPTVIGVDIFRDQPVPSKTAIGYQQLSQYWQNQENVIGICGSSGDAESQSIAPPPQLSPQQVGFVDLYDDKQPTNGQDDTVRRYLLSRSPGLLEMPSRCQTSYSFALQLAYRYLNANGISGVTDEQKNWRFASVIVKRLENRIGGYQRLNDQGNQLLINYRNTPQIAKQIPVRSVLEGHFDLSRIKGHIVLIGVTAASVPDLHDTPYGEIRGVYVHGHVISQILSAVMDNRPLFWWWPQWGDLLWVWFWSLTGGVIVWRLRIPLSQGIAIAVAIVVLWGVCWLVLLQGGWLPFVPPLIVMVSWIFVSRLINKL
ncbi:MAG: CHASE2 domain-containing protein [Crocinitomicaceae bacterium]|nr:CHASE2 domain-containing protein [Crocinitomicaceae bacterium]